ncbi:MAG: bifunctional precorrin-2 dehydrogenase/sirohydrochlorin ferrochelatase [Proteobacteria bacterium]|nr:bifunctional precorrin-2 dehydrogenase/sirohydrochlorin ferrochelatase [Pseudomonadota bacterium]
MPYYPINLNCENRLCLVVGGGEVAERKVRGLLSAGARVKVVSPELSPALEGLARDGKITVERRPYRRGDLQGMFLVLAATDDPGVTRGLVEEARALPCLLNLADLPDQSDFILPALLERGDLSIGFSTSGRCPALAQWLRDRLAGEIGEEYEKLTVLLGDFRDRLLTKGVSPPTIRRCIREALDADLLKLASARDETGIEKLFAGIEARTAGRNE